jgi:hypothetical protein
MHFRKTGTLLKSAPPLRFPTGFVSADLDDLAHDVQRTINMFYQCAAVDEIEIKSRGVKRREWRIRLRSNNPRTWFDGHMGALFERVRAAQAGDRSGPVRSILLEAADANSGGEKDAFRVYSDESGATTTALMINGNNTTVELWSALPAADEEVRRGRPTVEKRRALARIMAALAEGSIACSICGTRSAKHRFVADYFVCAACSRSFDVP